MVFCLLDGWNDTFRDGFLCAFLIFLGIVLFAGVYLYIFQPFTSRSKRKLTSQVSEQGVSNATKEQVDQSGLNEGNRVSASRVRMDAIECDIANLSRRLQECEDNLSSRLRDCEGRYNYFFNLLSESTPSITSLEDCKGELSNRTYNALVRAGYMYIEEFATSSSFKALKSKRAIGPAVLDELRVFLLHHGYDVEKDVFSVTPDLSVKFIDLVKTASERLTESEKKYLSLRFSVLTDSERRLTLREIANEFGVTTEYARHLEVTIVQKLRPAIAYFLRYNGNFHEGAADQDIEEAEQASVSGE